MPVVPDENRMLVTSCAVRDVRREAAVRRGRRQKVCPGTVSRSQQHLSIQDTTCDVTHVCQQDCLEALNISLAGGRSQHGSHTVGELDRQCMWSN